MSEETRLILEKLENLDTGMKELRGDVRELKSDVAVLKSDVAKLQCDVAKLQCDVALLKIITDRYTYPMRKMDEALAFQKDKERMELDISGLKMDMHMVKLKIGLV